MKGCLVCWVDVRQLRGEIFQKNSYTGGERDTLRFLSVWRGCLMWRIFG